MATTLEDVARVVAKKAAKIGLTTRQLNLILDLAGDLEKHAEVEAFAFRRVDIGSVLTLISTNARYQIWLIQTELESVKTGSRQIDHLMGQKPVKSLPRDGETTLKCVFEPFDTRVKERTIWNSNDSVESFEGLRATILDLEGYEIVNQPVEAEKELVT